MSPPAFLLQVVETLENNTFPIGEPVSNIGEIVTRVTRVHDGSTVIKEDWQCVVLPHGRTATSWRRLLAMPPR
jgi:hypothetical protein